MTDQEIIEVLVGSDGDTHGVAEVLVARDVNAGEYEGCSSELELAFQEYQGRAERLMEAKYVVFNEQGLLVRNE